MNRRYFDIFVIGFALFSMFFGAGNIIFPPYLGLGSGPQWGLSFFCYYMADIGLAIFAIFALIRNRGDVDAITGRIGKVPGEILMAIVILCIGPLIALPRTGATAYEMLIIPTIGDIGSTIPVLIFFALVLLLSIRESSVIDILGKFLTPALFLGLMLLIIKGRIHPLGPIAPESMVESPIVDGINAGYQTMDVLAALIFGIVIVKTAASKGYTEEKTKFQIVKNSSIIAAIGLFVVYCGLTYLGAVSSTLYPQDINRSTLILNITQELLGSSGIIVLGIIVTLACITTAVALVTATAEYFSNLSHGKLKYEWLAIATSVLATVIATFGIDQIIALASPVLALVYPGVLTLIILSFFLPHYQGKGPFIGAMIGATLLSLCEVLNGFGAPFSFVEQMPLSGFGLAWILPACIGTAFGHLVGKQIKAK